MPGHFQKLVSQVVRHRFDVFHDPGNVVENVAVDFLEDVIGMMTFGFYQKSFVNMPFAITPD